jgi:hypothetical protein
MSKFKVGDKVRNVSDTEWDIPVGTVCTVAEVREGINGRPACIKLTEYVASNAYHYRYETGYVLVEGQHGAYTVHYDGYQVGDPHLTINDATNWIQDNGVGGLVYTILETIARRKFEVVEKVQRELKAI